MVFSFQNNKKTRVFKLIKQPWFFYSKIIKQPGFFYSKVNLLIFFEYRFNPFSILGQLNSSSFSKIGLDNPILLTITCRILYCCYAHSQSTDLSSVDSHLVTRSQH